MGTQDSEFNHELSRRKLLATAGFGGGAAVASLIATGEAETTPAPRQSSDPVMTPPVAGLHLQFGADASSEMVVSWHTLQPVRRPHVIFGRLDGTFEQNVEAKPFNYSDAKSRQIVYAYHAKLGRLRADSAYFYGAQHDGAEPEFGSFRTAPRGRAPLTFTSFGDQATPTLGKKFAPPAGVTLANPPYVNDNLGSPAAADTTLGVERLRPLFHLLNGDLCYANLADDRVRTWSAAFGPVPEVLPEVGPAGKRLAGSGENDAAHRGIVPRVLEGGPQILPRRRVQGVEHLGPVDGHIGDRAALLVQDVCERQY